LVLPPFGENDPWSSALLLHGEISDRMTGEPLEVQLVPIGANVLRRVFFDAAPVDCPLASAINRPVMSSTSNAVKGIA